MRKLFAVLALALAAACGSDSATNVQASIAGTYSLRTINGTPMPFILAQTGANKTEVTDDAITLNNGGTWTESGHYRTTTNGVATTSSVVDAGTYTLNGTAITLTSANTGVASGTVSGSTLTVVDQGLSAVYSK